jgi:O-methyltransferase domain
MHTAPRWLVRRLTRLTDRLAKLRRRLLPRHYAAIELGTMSWIAQGMSAFCELGLPDALANGAQTPSELAHRGYGREGMLFRMLRALAAYDIVRYVGHGRFALGHIGKALTGTHSAAAMIRYANAPWHGQAYAMLAQGVRTGRPAFELATGMPMFEFFSKNHDAGAIFDAAMQSLTPLFARAMARAYDFAQFRHVVDIGGGTGVLLATILAAFPRLRGTLFEIPSVVARTRETNYERALRPRLALAEGNMFEDSPPPADAYILSHILHDWNDDACLRILHNVRNAMRIDSRLLIYEIVAAAPSNEWSQDRITDLEMLAMLSGRERTREEFASLLAASGLRLSRIISTASAESIIEAILR